MVFYLTKDAAKAEKRSDNLQLSLKHSSRLSETIDFNLSEMETLSAYSYLMAKNMNALVLNEPNSEYKHLIKIETKEDFINFYEKKFFINLNKIDQFDTKDKSASKYLIYHQNVIDINAETIVNNLIEFENSVYFSYLNDKKVQKELFVILTYTMSSIKSHWIKNKSIQISALTAMAKIYLHFSDEFHDINNLKK